MYIGWLFLGIMVLWYDRPPGPGPYMRQLKSIICTGVSENDEIAAVEDFTDVDNILGMSWLAFQLRTYLNLALGKSGTTPGRGHSKLTF